MMKLFKQILPLLLITTLILLNASCKKDVDSQLQIISYSIKGQDAKVEIDAAEGTVHVQLPETTGDVENLVAEYTLSPGAKAVITGVEQESGITPNNYNYILQYDIVGAHNKKRRWVVYCTNNSYSEKWGLGRFIQEKVDNDNRSYDWYFDQFNTGYYNGINCGPTSATMVCKWSDTSFFRSPYDARVDVKPLGGGWTSDDMSDYLTQREIPYTIENLDVINVSKDITDKTLKNYLKAGKTLIVCVDMDYVTYNATLTTHKDKFYETAPYWAHFIVLKGYQIIDKVLYYQVYDPYSFNKRYPDDNSLMGRNRFYNSDDLYAALILHSWKTAWVISQKN